MKKVAIIYLKLAFSIIACFNALKVTPQNEIVFPTDSISSKNPFYLFNVLDKGNGIIETKYITYVDGIIKSEDEKVITGEVYSADKKIVKFGNKLMVLTIQQLNNEGEQIGALKIIRIAFRAIKPDVEYAIRLKNEDDSKLLHDNLKINYGQNNFETIPELNVEEIAQLKELYEKLYKKGNYKKYYLETIRIDKLEHIESTEATDKTKSLKFNKGEKLIVSK